MVMPSHFALFFRAASFFGGMEILRTERIGRLELYDNCITVYRKRQEECGRYCRKQYLHKPHRDHPDENEHNTHPLLEIEFLTIHAPCQKGSNSERAAPDGIRDSYRSHAKSQTKKPRPDECGKRACSNDTKCLP